MRWFKHLSAARNDERIADLEDRAGLEGYGFYFKMLEIVAEAMDNSDKCDATFSVSRWARQVNVTTKKFLFLVQCCADVGLMLVQRQSDVTPIASQKITVKIPNLLKYKDEYSKKSGHRQEIVRPKNIDTDTETDIETETELFTPPCIPPLAETYPQAARKTKTAAAKRSAAKNTDKDSKPDEPVPIELKQLPEKTTRTAARKTPLPADFGISESVRQWAETRGYDRLEERLEAFKLVSEARGYTYVDWDAAFKNAIRDDWAKLNQPPNGRTTQTMPMAVNGSGYFMTPHQRLMANNRRAIAEWMNEA